MFRHCFVACSLLASTIVLAQDKPKGVEEFNEFNAKPLEGWVWDEDERLQDLVGQLQQKELVLQEIDAKIARATGKKASSKMAGNMAWRSTQRMDLNGGGPVRWDAFYGRNAENFFYHPKDPNTTYHTNTVLQQVAPTTASGVAGNQGVPAHQRPPQFDYIYRGYENAQARAREQARDLADKTDEMKSRRRELEGEVVVLWMKLAFRVIDRDKLPENPALRFAFRPKAAGNDDASEQALALTSATQFLATAMLFNEALAEESPGNAFGGVSNLVKANRKAFEDGFLKLQSLRKEASDKTKPIGQFKFLSRELEDTAKTLSEGYKGWQDGDANEEEPAKFAGLKRIQDGVVRYSKILLALNELVGQMEKKWAVDLNTDSNEFTPRWDVTGELIRIKQPHKEAGLVILPLLNQQRQRQGAGNLIYDPNLEQAAKEQAKAMAEHNQVISREWCLTGYLVMNDGLVGKEDLVAKQIVTELFKDRARGDWASVHTHTRLGVGLAEGSGRVFFCIEFK